MLGRSVSVLPPDFLPEYRSIQWGAETPVHQIEILLPDIYNSIYVKAYGDNPVIEFSGESGTGIYFTDTGTTVGGEWDYLEYFDQWGNAAFSQNGKYGAVNRGRGYAAVSQER